MRSCCIILAYAAAFLCQSAVPVMADQDVLSKVRDRGFVKCAIGNRLVGDTRIGSEGYEGFFPEFCRVAALAIFADRNAVQMSPSLIRAGLESVSSGDVDIYVSNVTWTLSRDFELNLTPAAVLYHDGQGFMSHRGAIEGSLLQLQSARVCVSRATTTIGNLQDFIEQNGLNWEVLPFESSQGRNDAFFARRCDLLTTDRFALAAMRSSAFGNPEDYVLHDEIISKEPLVAYVSSKDKDWVNIVRWSIFATILAEEKGVTRSNIGKHIGNPDPEVRRLLGVDEISAVTAAGLDPLWARHILESSGNYGEIFDRYLGSESDFNLDRGLNRLWRDGGLMISPPFR